MSHTASSFSILCIGFTAHTTLRHGIKISRFQFFVLDSPNTPRSPVKTPATAFQFFVLDSVGAIESIVQQLQRFQFFVLDSDRSGLHLACGHYYILSILCIGFQIRTSTRYR